MQNTQQSLFQKIYAIAQEIPAGKVATYGQIAAAAGHPRCARQVGWALHQNPNPWNGKSGIPCHRVVNHFGQLAPSFAFGGAKVQQNMLEKEGIVFKEDGIVDLETFGFKFSL